MWKFEGGRRRGIWKVVDDSFFDSPSTHSFWSNMISNEVLGPSLRPSWRSTTYLQICTPFWIARRRELNLQRPLTFLDHKGKHLYKAFEDLILFRHVKCCCHDEPLRKPCTILNQCWLPSFSIDVPVWLARWCTATFRTYNFKESPPSFTHWFKASSIFCSFNPWKPCYSTSHFWSCSLSRLLHC